MLIYTMIQITHPIIFCFPITELKLFLFFSFLRGKLSFILMWRKGGEFKLIEVSFIYLDLMEKFVEYL